MSSPARRNHALLAATHAALLVPSAWLATRHLRGERDPLTGLRTRRFLDRRRAQQTTVVVFCDLDNFKQVNDRYGHAVGDTLLRAVGETLEDATRVDDIVVRYGGDEFLILARTADGVERMLRRLRGALDEVLLPYNAGVSFGLARVEDEGLAAALLVADSAMYEEKTGWAPL